LQLAKSAIACQFSQVHCIALVDLANDPIQRCYRALHGHFRDQVNPKDCSRWFSADAIDQVASSQADAVIVAAAGSAHSAICKRLAQSGKHLLVDTPLALSIERLQDYCQWNRSTDPIVQPILPYRHCRFAAEMVKQLQSGLIGRPLLAELVVATSDCSPSIGKQINAAARPLSDQLGPRAFGDFTAVAVPQIDLVNWLMGCAPTDCQRKLTEDLTNYELSYPSGFRLLVRWQPGSRQTSLRLQATDGWSDLTLGRAWDRNNKPLLHLQSPSANPGACVVDWVNKISRCLAAGDLSPNSADHLEDNLDTNHLLCAAIEASKRLLS
jgi:predicted dehydrogenase